jgi:hypothetical protein
MPDNPKPKDVFVINESGERKYWNRCGQAYVNRDGSLNVRLDLFPGVQLQIRDKKDKES